MTYEIVIVGSGPSGVAAALGFAENGIVPLILDVGYEAPDVKPPDMNFYDYRKANDAFDVMIGRNHEVLNHVIEKKTASPKVSSPYMQFVTREAEKLSPLNESASVLQSFAKGGLASAWGAGLYRCVDDDLVNIPISEADLSPYYDSLTREIGISGYDDDLTPFFGSTEGLLEPVRLSGKLSRLLSVYQKKRKELNAEGTFIGRPRLGVLTDDHDNRSACDYSNLEMWYPDLPYIYTPAFTLEKLIREKKVAYHKYVIVKSWSRENGLIVVNAQNIKDNSDISFKCKKLILAAGTINSTKIVLSSKKDFETRLPLKDNSLVQFPLIFLSSIGSKLEKDALSLTNLNVIFDLKELNMRLQGSIIELTSPARAVFFEKLPLAARDNLTFIRFFLPALAVFFLYLPSRKENEGSIRLDDGGGLEIFNQHGKIDRRILKKVASVFCKIGALTHPLFVEPPEHAIHYGGTLPMVPNPESDYQCSTEGELYGEPGVHIVDGSVLSFIPSKNLSFTLMANAMRIADTISNKDKKIE
jgi:choline dehydrogenase-like flavoprotein